MKKRFWGTHGSLPNSITEKHFKERLFHTIKISQKFKLKNDYDIKFFIDYELAYDGLEIEL